jgi:hypothetical protein
MNKLTAGSCWSDVGLERRFPNGWLNPSEILILFVRVFEHARRKPPWPVSVNLGFIYLHSKMSVTVVHNLTQNLEWLIIYFGRSHTHKTDRLIIIQF